MAISVILLFSALNSFFSWGFIPPNQLKTYFSTTDSSHNLLENSSDVTNIYFNWKNMRNTGLDMRHGPDLAEISPFYNSDGNISIDRLSHIQLCQKIVKTLECDSIAYHTKLSILKHFHFLFPEESEPLNTVNNHVTEYRVMEGGLLDDWNFDEFNISDF